MFIQHSNYSHYLIHRTATEDRKGVFLSVTLRVASTTAGTNLVTLLFKYLLVF